MSLLAGINKHLRNDPAVESLVNSRVFAGVIPQGQDIPCIVLTDITNRHASHLGGASGWVRASVQVDCWAESQAATDAIADAVRLRLHRPGDVSVATDVGSLEIDGVSFENEYSSFIRPEAGSRVAVRRRVMQFGISYRESVPF